MAMAASGEKEQWRNIFYSALALFTNIEYVIL